MSHFAVRVHPGELHFNAAHFITFNGSCENIHGHNFHLQLEARGENTRDAFVIDFVLLNKLAARICAELHDGVLIPTESDEITLTEREDDMLEIRSYDKRFILSRASCILLPITNTTAEMLAYHISNRLIDALHAHQGLGNLQTLEVAVEEADQQWGIYQREIIHD
ncbi:6-carboxytetrahydropterin synthase [Sedimenticola selenatireducens]|uniref:6-pyruvoyl trahydropterin synthase family protein n=1 Tax=Sedimenticola selenatireducens TaxID=191960 RepID=UPI002AAAF1E5|nr:6-carboxytetrahydropterin synthase [Sedimenticola selenatireducens]